MGCGSSINTNCEPSEEDDDKNQKDRRWSGIIQRKYRDETDDEGTSNIINKPQKNKNKIIKNNNSQPESVKSFENNRYRNFNTSGIQVINEQEFTLKPLNDNEKSVQMRHNTQNQSNLSNENKSRNNDTMMTRSNHNEPIENETMMDKSINESKFMNSIYSSSDFGTFKNNLERSKRKDKSVSFRLPSKKSHGHSKHPSRKQSAQRSALTTSSNQDSLIKQEKPKKMEKSPLVDIFPLIKEGTNALILSEYEQHRNYLSTSENKKVIPLPKPLSPQIMQYTNYVQLHSKRILCICVFKPHVENMYYATSSADNTIRLWTDTFIEYSAIKTPKAISVSLVHYKKKYLLSAEGIYVVVYRLTHDNKIKYILRDHISNINTMLMITEDYCLSAGDDCIMRLWNVEEEKTIRYYEGHEEPVKIVAFVNNRRNIASSGTDKKIIIWESLNANIINSIDVYYTCSGIVGTSTGFIVGSYDNKIRIYNLVGDNGSVTSVFDTDYYNVGNFIMGECEENNILFSNGINEIISLDLYGAKITYVYKGLTSNIMAVVKNSEWENNSRDGEINRNIIAICEDGYIYSWKYIKPIINVIHPVKKITNASLIAKSIKKTIKK